MANSGDPDQTASEGAVWSGSALFAYSSLSDAPMYEILGQLMYLDVQFTIQTNDENIKYLSIAPGKAPFCSTKMWYFSYFSMKTYVKEFSL